MLPRASGMASILLERTNASLLRRVRRDSADQTAWAEVADRSNAALLGVPPGAPLMVFRRTSAAGSTLVEHITSWYRGDRYQVHMSLMDRTP